MIETLASGANTPLVCLNSNRECVVYSVFGDESADETKARVFAVSRVLGSTEQWKDVESAWRDRSGGRIFHAVDCETNRGDFANSSNAENKALYKDLTQILCRSGLVGRSHAIDLAGWTVNFPDALEGMPYLICFRHVVYECGSLVALCIPQDNVEFTFDQRRETNHNAAILYEYLTNIRKWKGSAYLEQKVSFATKKYIGVQVADLVAREAMKHLDNIVGPEKRGVRRSMNALLNTNRFSFHYWMRDYFEKFKQNPSVFARQSGVDTDDLQQWIHSRRLSYNMSNLHRYMIEKWPEG